MKNCGIYKIRNKVNGKIYIGLSQNISARWLWHQKDAFANKKITPLYKDMRKYGINCFSLEIIELCSIKLLPKREIYWIARLKSKVPNGYNCSFGGETFRNAKFRKRKVGHYKICF
ncbi:MAG: GIY-YIG nuclease family protein [Mycoplasmataceae bacterium]|jgi:group I intron endonuclease|nr:GIY-YIG nuclease family protein [Mycoplasmataceae bacterium]